MFERKRRATRVDEIAETLVRRSIGLAANRTEGEIVVYASRPLVRTLMEHDLVDELRLTVFPVALGAGERLFGETSDKRPLRLIDTKTIGSGLAHLTYERVREA
jgi:dihydrofolate reductase